MAAPTRRPSAAPPAALPRRGFIGRLLALVAAGTLLPRAARAAPTGAEPFIGELMLFAGNFPPRSWAHCNGQLMPIAQNTALFSILGTMYGGNGQTTFALPDLRGRVPMHFGQGPGLSNYDLGQLSGEETHTLLAQEMPAHSHTAVADAANGVSDSPAGNLPAKNPAGIPQYGTGTGAALAPQSIAVAGGSQPHNNLPPYLVLNWCICLEGIYPSRN